MGLFSRAAVNNSNNILKEAIDKGAFLVDVRTPEEFSYGSVEGAVNIPLNEVPDQVEKFKGKNGVVVFCQSGGRSGSAKHFLEGNGIENVINGGPWNYVAQVKNS